MKMFKTLENPGLLIKDVTKNIGNETRASRSEFWWIH